MMRNWWFKILRLSKYWKIQSCFQNMWPNLNSNQNQSWCQPLHLLENSWEFQSFPQLYVQSSWCNFDSLSFPLPCHLGTAIEIWMLLSPLNILCELLVPKQEFLGVVQVLQILVGEQSVDLRVALKTHPKEISNIVLQVLVLVPWLTLWNQVM